MLDVLGFDGKRRQLPATAEGIWPAMQEGVALNRALGPVPDPFGAGVCYRREKRTGDGIRPDTFLTVDKILREKEADCEDLAAWMAAWLQEQGDSSAQVALIEFPMGGWHAVTVTRRLPLRPDPSIYPSEMPRYRGAGLYAGPKLGWNPAGLWVVDPSYALGMRDAAAPTLYHPATSRGEREPLIEGVSRPMLITVGAALVTAALVSSLNRPLTQQVRPGGELGRLPWARLVSDAFLRRVVEIAAELQVDPRFLLAVMYAESRFRPNAINADTGASGLIQFMPRTAQGLNTTVEALRGMTALAQLEYVRRYYLPARGRLKTLADVYTWTFRPRDLGLPLDADHYARGQDGYKFNAGLDINKDGVIERWEPAAKAARLLQEEESRGKTGVAGVAGTAELLAELDRLSSVSQVSAYISRLKLEAPGTMVDALTRWEKKVLTVSLAEAKGIATNLTYQAMREERSFDPTWTETAANAATATADAALTMAKAPVELVKQGADAVASLSAINDAANPGKGGNGLPLLLLAGAGFWFLTRKK